MRTLIKEYAMPPEGQPPQGPELYARIKAFCFEQGISISEFCRRADISRSTAERWKGGSRPSERMRGRANRVFYRAPQASVAPVEDLLS